MNMLKFEIEVCAESPAQTMVGIRNCALDLKGSLGL